MSDQTVTITSIAAAPLLGESPQGGWSHEIRPEDSVHTLIAVHTDEGVTGYGSVFTNGGLAQAALKVLEPLFLGENALEPERVTESCTRTPSGWAAAARSPTPSAASTSRSGTSSARRPASRSGACSAAATATASALRLAPDGRAGAAWRERRRRLPRAGLPRLQDRLGAVRPRDDRQARRGDRPRRPRGGRRRRRADGRCRRQRRLLAATATNGRCAPPRCWRTTTSAGSRRRCGRTRSTISSQLRRAQPRADRRRRGADPPAERSSPGSRGGAFDIVQPDVTKVGGISEERRIAWMADDHGVRYVPHGWNTALGLAADLQLAAALAATPIWSNTSAARPTSTASLTQPFDARRRRHLADPASRPASASRSTRSGSPITRRRRRRCSKGVEGSGSAGGRTFGGRRRARRRRAGEDGTTLGLTGPVCGWERAVRLELPAREMKRAGRVRSPAGFFLK